MTDGTRSHETLCASRHSGECNCPAAETNYNEPDLIPEMPKWFEEYLNSLSRERAIELLLWVEESNDDSAVFETILEAINTTRA
jgi:hypothetical protein